MNLYVRFFDKEALVSDGASVIEFLASIPQIKLENIPEKKLQKYLEGDSCYPFKGKVDDRNYFLVIKTEEPTLEAFQMAQEAINQHPVGSFKKVQYEHPESRESILMTEREGWYEAGLVFKRAMPGDETRKFEYVDTPFRAKLKAKSGMDCYTKLVEHLKARPEVDGRSQFPSVKGKNFDFKFLEE